MVILHRPDDIKHFTQSFPERLLPAYTPAKL